MWHPERSFVAVKGAQPGAYLTANIALGEIQEQNTILLSIENAMNEPDEKKDDSVRLWLSDSLLQYKSYMILFSGEPFLVKSLYRDDLLIKEACDRLGNRKIKLRHVEEK
jgi:hypothetical protein